MSRDEDEKRVMQKLEEFGPTRALEVFRDRNAKEAVEAEGVKLGPKSMSNREWLWITLVQAAVADRSKIADYLVSKERDPEAAKYPDYWSLAWFIQKLPSFQLASHIGERVLRSYIYQLLDSMGWCREGLTGGPTDSKIADVLIEMDARVRAARPPWSPEKIWGERVDGEEESYTQFRTLDDGTWVDTSSPDSDAELRGKAAEIEAWGADLRE